MPPIIASFLTRLGPVGNFLSTSPYGFIIILLIILFLVLLVALPLAGKLRRRSIKKKETKDIMKDLLTWRHLAQLVKGGDEQNKAKQELSDNIIQINELLRLGFVHASRNARKLYDIPWYMILGEPRSGKSSLLAASELELVPSTVEDNPQEDPTESLPVRFWTGAKAVVCDISGKVFFDRWLEASSAEWDYIARRICRRRRRRVLDGVILAIPADALLADDHNLSAKKAILMADELGKLLQYSGMRLPCYVVVTKLDMVSGFQEYARAFAGDLRHQILGFKNETNLFHEDTFTKFWNALSDRLRSGSKQLLFPLSPTGEGAESETSRMDMAGKIWLFPDNFAVLYKNLRAYLNILFGEDNFHGTKNTFFEGVYFTSAKDLGFSFSPDIAALAGRDTDDVLIPVTTPEEKGGDGSGGSVMASDSSSTALVVVNAARILMAPYLQNSSLMHGYFIRDLLHRRIFVPSPRAEFTRSVAIRRHIPQYALCILMVFLGVFWLSSAIFRNDELRVSLMQSESYYDWLDSVLQKGTPFRSPLIKKINGGRFTLDTEPVEGEALTSRVQFYNNALIYRDLKTDTPLGFKLSEALVFWFDRNMGYREKAFIANQLHKSMVRIPVIKNVGERLIEQVDTQVLDGETREVILSFISLDKVEDMDFYRSFSDSQFKLDSMIRYLIPDVSNDTMGFLNSYKPRYDREYALQMDVDYIYSDEYKWAKQAALDTMLSAWRRRAVYPDSIYAKIRSLISISEGIITDYGEINTALSRINSVSSLVGVEDAVYGWKKLTDHYKNLISQGRAVFEEVQLLLRAAHIPLGFDTGRTQNAVSNVEQVADLFRFPVLDAFGDNLINNYLFNDRVISYAVRDYTQLFDADMEFIKQETGSGRTAALGQVIAEQNSFSGNLNQEVEELHKRARALQGSGLLSQKIDEKPDSPSLFMVTERILNLASDLSILPRKSLPDTAFEASWQEDQSNIKAAFDAFDAFVKPYLDNNRLSVLATNARVMLLAEAYYNQYTIFTNSLSFLNTFEGNIAAVIEAGSNNTDLFSFSGNAIAGLFGGFYFNRGYNPLRVKTILDDMAAFVSLLKPGGDAKTLPLFLQNVDKQLYQPTAFMNYLSSYITYWGNYPDQVYVSAGSWERFLGRASAYKSFQINSVLSSIHAKCLEWLNLIDNSLLNDSLVALKNKYAASLGDKIALLNQFQSIASDKMFLSWVLLPADPQAAYTTLRALGEDDLKVTYLSVYTSPDTVGIGWWNSFVIDGFSLLARHADETYMAQLVENMERYKAWPLYTDAPYSGAVSIDTVKELAALLEAMGAGFTEAESPDPVQRALHHSLFRGQSVRNWARTIYQIAAAITDTKKPLTWTVYQVPEETQRSLGGRGRLLAIDRFRYVGTSVAGAVPRMSSTYINEKQVLLQGSPEDAAITFQFYRVSRDKNPEVTITFNNRWSVFDLYLRNDYVADDKGGRYIPVYLEDEGGRHVYYLGVEFNNEIPGPSSWYSSGNWPDIISFNGMIAERR